jgi:hypothetical protein
LRRSARIIHQPTGTVAYVTDETVCEVAIRALKTRAKTPGRQRQVYVYNLGSQYAVEGSGGAGERIPDAADLQPGVGAARRRPGVLGLGRTTRLEAR